MNKQVWRRNWKRYLKAYDARAYRILKPVFNKWGKKIDFDSMNEENYSLLIDIAVRSEDLVPAYEELYRQIGLIHGRRVGKALNKQAEKMFVYDDFQRFYNEVISVFIGQYGSERIVSVTETYKETIKKMLSTRVADDMTVSEAAKEIERIVNKNTFYRWQAERIARTESIAAANYGASKAGENSGYVTESVWLSSLDSRTRTSPYDHASMNGRVVQEGERFNVSGDSLAFPGDPSGSAGNVIQCRCALAVRPKRDSNGDLIFQ